MSRKPKTINVRNVSMWDTEVHWSGFVFNLYTPKCKVVIHLNFGDVHYISRGLWRVLAEMKRRLAKAESSLKGEE